jgi:hypothetical protein
MTVDLRVARPVLTFLLTVIGLSGSAAAQTSPDFSFGRPRGSAGIRVGWVRPNEAGDLFAFVRENLTIEKGDFRSGGVGTEITVAFGPWASVVAGYDYSASSMGSETRRFIGSDGLPIAQTTRLAVHQWSAGIKLPLTAPGRAISRYAWIPNAFVPYAGGGVALVRYSFSQDGEFVDFVDTSIFRHSFISTGSTSGAYAAGGVDWQLWRRVALALEGRYVWADAPLTFSFSGFEGIDLSGFRVTTGISIPF